MPEVFNAYAAYYDLLYRDKDYSAEARYVDALIRKYHPSARKILELGCGTGKHGRCFVDLGYEVYGIDQSPTMLAEAVKRKIPGKLAFGEGDIRSIKLEREFDSVISLFHVVSYQTANDDLQRVFRSARTHVPVGGVFIFDCWYGPAVLTDRPTIRLKSLEDEKSSVTRKARPEMFPNDNRVDVHYEIDVEDKVSGKKQRIDEVHRMRYLFKPEVEVFLKEAGFDLIGAEEWLTGKELGWGSWNAVFVGRAA